jgi:predicted nuclease of restriction endonuclease-like (RecB) superfamily
VSTPAFSLIPENYDQFLRNLKEQIRVAQVRASLAVNSELILLYWQIGQAILERQRNEGWGAKIIGKIAPQTGIS